MVVDFLEDRRIFYSVDTKDSHAGHFPARYWRRTADGQIQCTLCPRDCKLKDGQRGLCFVRAREGDEMVLTTYGRSSGFCVDPIEKKPLNHFLPGTPVLSFGTAGCNLTCTFCQNWDISKSREVDTLADSATPESIAQAARDHGCKSVAFTYNDPVIFLEYAVDTALACHDLGIKTVAVTAGYIHDQPRKEFFEHIDAANVDLKGFTEGFYKKLCTGKLTPVLDTLIYLKHESNTWFEITTLLIPGENDSEREIHDACQWIVENIGVDVPWHFSAFHPDYRMRDKDPTSKASLRRAREIAKEHGIRYVYTGNVDDEEGHSTYCHSCHQRLIGRNWYQLSEWNLDSRGCCNNCGEMCPGLFESEPGTWGAKRLAVRMQSHGRKLAIHS